MDIKDLCEEAHKTAIEKGWWEDGDNPLKIPATCHMITSELVEMTQLYRSSFADQENIAEELADVWIRLADLTGKLFRDDIEDFERIVESKMKDNKTRPYKHGKGF